MGGVVVVVAVFEHPVIDDSNITKAKTITQSLEIFTLASGIDINYGTNSDNTILRRQINESFVQI
jgi:RecA-family ATPase